MSKSKFKITYETHRPIYPPRQQMPKFTLEERDKRIPACTWGGDPVSKDTLNNLQVGDQVRLRVCYENWGTSAIYFQIIKIDYLKKELNKPRKFYGFPLDIYCDYDEIQFKATDIIEFKKLNIVEVPGWKGENIFLNQKNKKMFKKYNENLDAIEGYNQDKDYYKKYPEKYDEYDRIPTLFLNSDIIKEKNDENERLRECNRYWEKVGAEEGVEYFKWAV